MKNLWRTNMNRSLKTRLAATSLLLLALGLVISSPDSGQAQGGSAKDVVVVNTPGQPVPTVVNNEVLVNGTVALNPLGNGVQVLNNVTNPAFTRAADNPARQPFHREALPFIAPGLLNATDTSIIVPADKYLVIETVSATATVPLGQNLRVRIRTTAGGQLGGHHIDLVDRGAFQGMQDFKGTHAVRFYADPGSMVEISIARNDTLSFVQLNLSISGHLVDMP